MDRNKSAYKLKGIPPVLWINLEADTDRRKHMEDQFAEWEIEDHTRISGIDAREGDGFEPHLSGTVPHTMIANEIGCCMSHLKAIKYFIEEMDCDEVMIMEDDALFETVRYWPFTYKEASALFPYNFDAMQLTTINPAVVYVTLHNRFINDFSAAVYVLKRSHAQKIYNAHIRGNKFKMDMDVRPRATSEDLIFESGKVYCIPLFLYRLDLGSSIHPEHIDIFHRNSYNGISNFWVESSTMEDWKTLFNWNCYLGRLPPGWDENGKVEGHPAHNQ
ncbi:MAG: glycosyltransferase family 25 protein [Candidatus Poseidoniales archaeon]